MRTTDISCEVSCTRLLHGVSSAKPQRQGCSNDVLEQAASNGILQACGAPVEVFPAESLPYHVVKKH